MASIPVVRKIPWRRKWQPTPVFLPGESHGQRSLQGYSSWGHKELDTTEVTEHTALQFKRTQNSQHRGESRPLGLESSFRKRPQGNSLVSQWLRLVPENDHSQARKPNDITSASFQLLQTLTRFLQASQLGPATSRQPLLEAVL